MATTKSRASRIKRFFSFGGRATRTEWWLVGVSQWLAIILFVSIAGINWLKANSSSLLVFAFFGVLFWLSLATNVRRLHDMDRSGWWGGLLLLLNGIGQLVAMVWLGLFDGTSGGNRFGPNPRLK